MTDIEIMDRAVWKYLSKVSDKIVYAPTNKAVQSILKDEKYVDNIPYTFISFYREPTFGIDMERYNFTAAQYGDFTRLRENADKTREAQFVQNIPVNLTYQVDIWAAKQVSVQQTAVGLISELYMNNQILVSNMNPEGEPARFHFTDIEWMDNSDLEIENEQGKLYRHTIKFTIDSRIKIVRNLFTSQFCDVPVNIYEES